MGRNLDKRVEVMVPVTNPKHQVWLDQVFVFGFAHDSVRWELDPCRHLAPLRARRLPPR